MGKENFFSKYGSDITVIVSSFWYSCLAADMESKKNQTSKPDGSVCVDFSDYHRPVLHNEPGWKRSFLGKSGTNDRRMFLVAVPGCILYRIRVL